jgi:hypothetical protein
MTGWRTKLLGVAAALSLIAMLALAPTPINAGTLLSGPIKGKVSLGGTMRQDSKLTIKISDQPPQNKNGRPPFAVVVKVNDWARTLDGVSWNEATQEWQVSWDIPPAMTDAQVVVTTLFADGSCSTRSFTVL